MITVRQILEARLYPLGARLVGGERGLDSLASWVVTAHARTPAVAPLQGGEVVLIPNHALRYLGGEESLPTLTSGFKAAGASALCVWTQPGGAAIRHADEAGVPLVQVAGASPAEVERELLDYISAQLRHGIARQHDREARLLDMLASHRGLDTIVRALAETLSRPSAYLPLSGPPVASVGDSFTLPDGFWERVPREPVVRSIPDEDRGSYWIAPVLRMGTLTGALAVRAGDATPDPDDQYYILQTATAISVETGRHEATAAAGQRMHAELCSDIFAGRSAETVGVRASTLGVEVPVPGLITIVAGRERSSELLPAAHARLIEWLQHHVRFPATSDNGGVTALLPLAIRGDSPTRALLNALGPHAARTAIGVSDPVQSLSGVPRAVEEARTALAISRAARGGAPTMFRETGAYGLLVPLASSPSSRREVDRILGPLEEYDAKHQSSLMDTLRTFLEENGNASASAERLHLHRNSLAYRLRRVEELTGMDLEDSENRLILALALHLRLLLGE